jgi:hypothetical protein
VLPDLISKAKEILSLGARQAFLLTLIAWAILLLPQSAAKFLGINELRTTYRTWIGLVALAATVGFAAILLTDFAPWIFNQLQNKWCLRKEQAERAAEANRSLDEMKALLHNLSSGERSYLHHYLEDQFLIKYFDPGDPIIRSLEGKGIVSNTGGRPRLGRQAFEIELWAYDYLPKQRELLSERGTKNIQQSATG